MKIPVIKNTVTNYIVTGVRMLEGVLIARWIINFLGMESYGLWALLWSFFVYALLLDFGCGAAAQKYTAAGLYKEPENYSGVISTIFSFHCLMALVIAAATFGCSFILPWLLDMHDPVKLAEARVCFFIFGFGAAMLFPTGIFPEMLVGLQRIYLRNYVTTVSKIIELAGVLVIFKLHGGLVALVAFGMGMSLITNVIMGVCVLRLLPRLKLRLTWRRDKWREIAGFSGFVYLGVLSRMVLSKSSRLLISIFCGVTSVGMFQLSAKLSDLCLSAVNQYQENISPISGALHRRGRHIALGKIILGAMRWNSFAACGVMLTAFLLTEPLLQALFKVDDPAIVGLSRWFLLSMYLSASMRNVPHRYFLMSDMHRFATGILAVEAVANFALNIAMLGRWGIAVVIYNSIAVKLLIALFAVLPTLIRRLRLPVWKFIRYTYLEPLIAGIPSVLFLLVLMRVREWSPWEITLIGAPVSGGIYLLAMNYFFPLRIWRKLKKRLLHC